MLEKEIQNEEIEEIEAQKRRSLLIEMLHKKGYEDAETRDLLIEWRKTEEGKVEKLKGEEYIEGQIRLIIEQAKIYEEAGLIAEAMEELNDALEYAFQARKDDLYKEIELKIREIEKKLKK